MLGRDIGNLSLLILEGNMTSLIWSASGNHGNRWLPKQIQVYASNVFQLVFTATSSGSYRGDIAIDDITVRSGRCPVLYQCDFDHLSLCNLYNDNSTDDFDWSFGSHVTKQSSTGPQSDHTSGKGRFLYVDASAPRLKGDEAKLFTPTFISTGHCLTLWYYMYGRDVASLKILIKLNNGTETVLSETHGNLGETWYKSTINIPASNISSQIVFVGQVGASYTSDIAIDDITLSNTNC